MDSTYCCGDSLTLADFYVYGLLNWIGMNTLDGVPHTIILESASLCAVAAMAFRRAPSTTPSNQPHVVDATINPRAGTRTHEAA